MSHHLMVGSLHRSNLYSFVRGLLIQQHQGRSIRGEIVMGTADVWGVVATHRVGYVGGLQVWALDVDGGDLFDAFLLCV